MHGFFVGLLYPHSEMTISSPVPTNLRNALIRSIESLPDEDLPLVHEVILHAEKDRLWREISGEAEAERRSGRWDGLPEIIAQVRAKMRKP
jgi:hypothetical protein